MSADVLVYGAYGHTGRFVVAELRRRGLSPVLAGRDPARVSELAARFPGLEARTARVGDAESLARAARGTAVVINCAGPFLDTAVPVAAAAVHAGAHYLDITAEQAAVAQVYRAQAELGGGGAVAVIPALAFFGGLPDLLATTALGGWKAADEITVAIGVDRWWPTEGTRKTGQRNTAARLVVDGGRLVPIPGPAAARDWAFPAPLGHQALAAISFSEIITMSRHLTASRISTYLSASALDDVASPATPGPVAVDEAGRSAQQFAVEVVARRGPQERRISVAGRDIYAFTAPLVAEAAQRLIDGRARARGAVAPGEAFHAGDFLAALSPGHLTIRAEGVPGFAA